MLDPTEFDLTARALADSDVAILTSGPVDGPMPPLTPLRERGVRVFAGSDNVRDAWSPFGSGDMLERATLIAARSRFRTDTELAVAFELVTTAAAAELGLSADYGVAAGARANLVVVEAATLPEAVAAHPPRRLVLHDGHELGAQGLWRAEQHLSSEQGTAASRLLRGGRR
jgi:cytosine deaminase